MHNLRNTCEPLSSYSSNDQSSDSVTESLEYVSFDILESQCKSSQELLELIQEQFFTQTAVCKNKSKSIEIGKTYSSHLCRWIDENAIPVMNEHSRLEALQGTHNALIEENAKNILKMEQYKQCNTALELSNKHSEREIFDLNTLLCGLKLQVENTLHEYEDNNHSLHAITMKNDKLRTELNESKCRLQKCESANAQLAQRNCDLQSEKELNQKQHRHELLNIKDKHDKEVAQLQQYMNINQSTVAAIESKEESSDDNIICETLTENESEECLRILSALPEASPDILTHVYNDLEQDMIHGYDGQERDEYNALLEQKFKECSDEIIKQIKESDNICSQELIDKQKREMKEMKEMLTVFINNQSANETHKIENATFRELRLKLDKLQSMAANNNIECQNSYQNVIQILKANNNKVNSTYETELKGINDKLESITSNTEYRSDYRTLINISNKNRVQINENIEIKQEKCMIAKRDHKMKRIFLFGLFSFICLLYYIRRNGVHLKLIQRIKALRN